MARTPLLPPAHILISLILMAALHVLVPVAQLIVMPWKLVGAAVILVGGWLTVSSSNLFDRRGPTVKPFQESTALVVEGPYRFTRNPMYLGLLIVQIGVAVVLGSAAPFVMVPILAVALDRRFITHEERALSARFGAEYAAYARRGRRWL